MWYGVYGLVIKKYTFICGVIYWWNTIFDEQRDSMWKKKTRHAQKSYR